MDAYQTHAKYDIAETCVASISLEDLKGLSEDKSSEILSPSTKLTYGTIRGSEKLRTNLANLYSAKKTFQTDNILITPGAVRLFSVLSLSLRDHHTNCETFRRKLPVSPPNRLIRQFLFPRLSSAIKDADSVIC